MLRVNISALSYDIFEYDRCQKKSSRGENISSSKQKKVLIT